MIKMSDKYISIADESGIVMLYKIYNDDGNVTKIESENKQPVTSILFTDDKNVFIGTHSNVVYQYNIENGTKIYE